MQKAMFFDRDGTLNVKSDGYVSQWDQFRWRIGAISAIKACNKAGYLVFVATNQAGVAHGHYAALDVTQLHLQMNYYLSRHAAHVDAFYYCPHHPRGRLPKYSVDCRCRKPKPGMLESAIAEFDIDARNSYMVGDQLTDVQAASAAGVNGVLLRYNEDVGTVVNFLLQKAALVAVG